MEQVLPEVAKSFRKTLRELYYGKSHTAQAWRMGLLLFDVFTIFFFVVSATLPWLVHYPVLDWAIGLVLLMDYCLRLAAAKRVWREAFSSTAMINLIIIISFFAEAFIGNLGFLKIIRVLRSMRSYHAAAELRRLFPWFRRHEEIINSTINLVVFIFIVSAVVYVFEAQMNPGIKTYLDALYFTVSTLTTTGYGDIIMSDPVGRWLTIVIMVFGVALFLRLIQTVFRPAKVKYSCSECGLNRHDTDAVHCKHCGTLLNIPTEGRWQ